MAKIYLVEDEVNLANVVATYLQNEGHEVKHFTTGEEAVKEANANIDLWILDIMLPGHINGYDLIKQIREFHSEMPIIFTSARDQDIDRVLGLELGGDDYLAKPYSIRELMLRVRNILQRKSGKENGQVVKYGPYEVNLDTRQIRFEGNPVELTSKEYDLFELLFKNQSQAFGRKQILDAIWGKDYVGSDRVVDDLMRRLRQKMPKLRVETLYGYGYRLL